MLGRNYAPAKVVSVAVPKRQELQRRQEQLQAAGKLSAHDAVIGHVLATVMSAGGQGGHVSERQLLDFEHDGFLELIRTHASQARIEHMLKTGRTLKN
jgi:3-hydroxyacyl-CoA dehydrogenase